MSKRIKQLIIILSVGVILTSCAEPVNIELCVTSTPYGFWSGLLHGLIVVISFIGSLFSDNITIYAVNNNGGLYNLGFMIGISMNILSTSIKITRNIFIEILEN